MDDQLDNDLKKRIREVFDNYEDTQADEGWLLLREKFPEKAKRRPVAWLWWGSVAALLLLFAGLFWLNNKPVINKQKMALNKNQLAHSQTPAINAAKDSIQSNEKADSVINSLQSQNIANNVKPLNPSLKSRQKKLVIQPTAPAVLNRPDSTAVANISKKGNTSTALTTIDPGKKPDQYIEANKIGNKLKVDTLVKPGAKNLAASTVQGGINMQEETKKVNKTPFADDKEVQADNKTEKYKSTGKAVRFGIYAATYFNYAKGSNNQLNVGAGVTSDIRLGHNLNLSTGVSIAQNSLSYASQPPATDAQKFYTSAVAANAKITSYAPGQNTIYSAAVPTLKNYNANLVGLDIPLNLKYEFNPEKSPAYVSIGLSSGTFINETYTSSYNYTVPFVPDVSSTSDQTTKQSFNSFYFGKTLNFSFGTGYSLGQNSLIIEPFLKYPLQGLGSEQLKFGAGGINLKFNIQARKK